VPDCNDVPLPSCRTAPQSSFAIRDELVGADDRISWLWRKGSATQVSEISNPTLEGRFLVCLYPDSGPLGAQITLPRNAGWESRKSSGYLYRDKQGNHDGASQVRLRTGAEGKVYMRLRGRGANLPQSVLPTTGAYTVQLIDTGTGDCWGSVFANGSLSGGDFNATQGP
jgi:hypothetical protein